MSSQLFGAYPPSSSPSKESTNDPRSVCGLSNSVIFMGSQGPYIKHSLASCFDFVPKKNSKRTGYRKSIASIYISLFFSASSILTKVNFAKRKNETIALKNKSSEIITFTRTIQLTCPEIDLHLCLLTEDFSFGSFLVPPDLRNKELTWMTPFSFPNPWATT